MDYAGQARQYGQQYQNYSGQANSALGQLQNYQQNMVDPTQLYKQAQQDYGVQDQFSKLQSAQNAVAQTNNLISQLPQNIANTQAGTEMTQSQRANLMQTQMAPLQQQYSSSTSSANAASNIYQALLGQAATQAQFGVQGQQMHLGALQNVYSDLFGQAGQAQQGQLGMSGNLAQIQAAQAIAGGQVEAARIAAAGQASQLAAMQQLYKQFGLGGMPGAAGSNPALNSYLQQNNPQLKQVVAPSTNSPFYSQIHQIPYMFGYGS